VGGYEWRRGRRGSKLRSGGFSTGVSAGGCVWMEKRRGHQYTGHRPGGRNRFVVVVLLRRIFSCLAQGRKGFVRTLNTMLGRWHRKVVGRPFGDSECR